tara:strand:- start:1026 stop:2312 length:1287 start_codon:yes stop_codon:yes gene_type:complete
MGFFSFIKKAFKGVTKVFRSVGKFIKKGFQKLGKFMNKFGILGQIGMALLTSYVGGHVFGALMKGAGGVGTAAMQGLEKAATLTGVKGSMAKLILSGVEKAVKVGGVLKNTYNATIGSVTKAIGNVVKPVMKRIGNVIPGINMTSVDSLGNLYTPKAFDDKMFQQMGFGLKNTGEFAMASGAAAREGAKGLFTGTYNPATMGADFSAGLTAGEVAANKRVTGAVASSPSMLKRKALETGQVNVSTQLANAEANYAARGDTLTISQKAAIARGDAASMGVSDFDLIDSSAAGIIDVDAPLMPTTYAETVGTTAQGTADSLLADSKVATEGGGAFSIKKGFEDAAKVTVSQNIMGALQQQDDPRPMGSYVPQSNFLDMQNQIFSIAGVDQPLPAGTPSSAPRRTVDFNNINFDFYELEQQNNTSPNYAMA